MLLPKLRFWLRVVVAWGTNSAPSSKPSSLFSVLSKAKTARSTTSTLVHVESLRTSQRRWRITGGLLLGPVSYRSPKRKCLRNFSLCPESFRHALSGQILLRKERLNEQETDNATGSVCSGELDQRFRSGRREARRHSKRGNETKRNEAGLHGEGRNETRFHGERQHEAR